LQKKDLIVAEHLYEKGDNSWCLFIGHIVLEKVLKAFIVRDRKITPPKINDLVRLADTSNLVVSDEQREFLNKVNDFNLETRYPDYKQSFYKICTKEYTTTYLDKIKEFYNWLISQIR